MDQNPGRVTSSRVIGASIFGSTLAWALHEAGHSVTLSDQVPSPEHVRLPPILVAQAPGPKSTDRVSALQRRAMDRLLARLQNATRNQEPHLVAHMATATDGSTTVAVMSRPWLAHLRKPLAACEWATPWTDREFPPLPAQSTWICIGAYALRTPLPWLKSAAAALGLNFGSLLHWKLPPRPHRDTHIDCEVVRRPAGLAQARSLTWAKLHDTAQLGSTFLRLKGRDPDTALEPEVERADALGLIAEAQHCGLNAENGGVWTGFRASLPDARPVMIAAGQHPGFLGGGGSKTLLWSVFLAEHLAGIAPAPLSPADAALFSPQRFNKP